jgi:hypothetical protein
MRHDQALKVYWLTFPEDPKLPFGVGITAYSHEDAFALLAGQNIDWHLRAKRIAIREGVTVHDLDQHHVVPNMGPMQFRGVWYPCSNIGFGAPNGSDYKKL